MNKTKINYTYVSIDYVEHTNIEERIVNRQLTDVINISENENFMKFETTFGYILIPIVDIKYVCIFKKGGTNG